MSKFNSSMLSKIKLYSQPVDNVDEDLAQDIEFGDRVRFAIYAFIISIMMITFLSDNLALVTAIAALLLFMTLLACFMQNKIGKVAGSIVTAFVVAWTGWLIGEQIYMFPTLFTAFTLAQMLDLLGAIVVLFGLGLPALGYLLKNK